MRFARDGASGKSFLDEYLHLRHCQGGRRVLSPSKSEGGLACTYVSHEIDDSDL